MRFFFRTTIIISLCLAVLVAAMMGYVAIDHNPQQSICITPPDGTCTIANLTSYFYGIILSWFVVIGISAAIAIQCVTTIYNILMRPGQTDQTTTMASLLILGGALPLAGALISQYGFNFAPCHFCLLQRYPYLVVIAAGILSLLVQRDSLRWRALIALAIYALLATATLGFIHTGIEQHWIAYAGGCAGQTPTDGSLEALRAAITAAPLVSCSEATAVFLTLSMATWNVIWACFMIFLIALHYHRFNRRRE